MESTVLVKAFKLLEAMSRGSVDHALGGLAQDLDMTKPTVHRILGCLVELGYVERREQGQYRLTGKLGQLTAPSQEMDLLNIAEPQLAKLNRDTGETSNLGVLRGPMIEYLRTIESNHPLRRVAESDGLDPFYCTALGRAIVANLPHATQESLLDQTVFEARTQQTITDPQKLRKLLIRVRREGYAVEQDETDIGVMCIGAPIMNGNQPVAAISVSVPSARADAKQKQLLIDAVVSTAKALSTSSPRR